MRGHDNYCISFREWLDLAERAKRTLDLILFSREARHWKVEPTALARILGDEVSCQPNE
jgi:hypothetical protein